MRITDFKVTIGVDGNPLEEFDVVELPMRKEKHAGITCYIPSEAGKCFVVRVDNSKYRASHQFTCRTFLDGILASKDSISSGSYMSVSGVQVNINAERPFMFSQLSVTDDDEALLPTQEVLDGLGTIRIDWFRTRVLSLKRRDARERGIDNPTDFDNASPVHEKTKKAGTHRVRLGEPRAKENTYTVDSQYLDDADDEPYLRFLFKYRPKAMLQAQGIAPIPKPRPDARREKRKGSDSGAGPSHLKRSRINNTKSPKKPRAADKHALEGTSLKVKIEGGDELETLLAERAAVEARRAALDEQIRAAEASQIKREPSPIVLNHPRGEVIDLTRD